MSSAVDRAPLRGGLADVRTTVGQPFSPRSGPAASRRRSTCCRPSSRKECLPDYEPRALVPDEPQPLPVRCAPLETRVRKASQTRLVSHLPFRLRDRQLPPSLSERALHRVTRRIARPADRRRMDVATRGLESRRIDELVDPLGHGSRPKSAGASAKSRCCTISRRITSPPPHPRSPGLTPRATGQGVTGRSRSLDRRRSRFAAAESRGRAHDRRPALLSGRITGGLSATSNLPPADLLDPHREPPSDGETVPTTGRVATLRGGGRN